MIEVSFDYMQRTKLTTPSGWSKTKRNWTAYNVT